MLLSAGTVVRKPLSPPLLAGRMRIELCVRVLGEGRRSLPTVGHWLLVAGCGPYLVGGGGWRDLKVVHYSLHAFNLRRIIGGGVARCVAGNGAGERDCAIIGVDIELLVGDIAVPVDLVLHIRGDLRIRARPMREQPAANSARETRTTQKFLFITITPLVFWWRMPS